MAGVGAEFCEPTCGFIRGYICIQGGVHRVSFKLSGIIILGIPVTLGAKMANFMRELKNVTSYFSTSVVRKKKGSGYQLIDRYPR